MHDCLKGTRRPAELKQHVNGLRKGDLLQCRAEIRPPIQSPGTKLFIQFNDKRARTAMWIGMGWSADRVETGKLYSNILLFRQRPEWPHNGFDFTPRWRIGKPTR